MSLELLKTTWKRNWTLLLIFYGVLTMYMGVMISMYNPQSMEELTRMLDIFPKELQDALGFSGTMTTLTSYLASWLYGMLMLGFPLVYCIILSGRLVVKMVDNGSFAYLLSTPNSRTKIILTQGIYALGTVLVLFVALFGTGVFICAASFPGHLDIDAFFKLNFTTMLVNMAVVMICFFCSCLFSESKTALGLGAGIPIAFLLMKMLGGASPDAKVIADVSIYGWYDPIKLTNGSAVWRQNLIYAGIVFALLASSILIFRRKRLAL